MSLPTEEDLARRLHRVGQPRKAVKAPPCPSDLEKLERVVLSHAQGLPAEKARAALRCMFRAEKG